MIIVWGDWFRQTVSSSQSIQWNNARAAAWTKAEDQCIHCIQLHSQYKAHITDLRWMTAHAVPMKCSGMMWKLPRTAHWSHSKTERMLPRLRESMQVDVIKLICSKSARFQVQSESFQVKVNASNSLKGLPSECDRVQIPNERMGLMRGFKPDFYLHCATSHRALVSLLAHIVLQTHGSIFQALTTSLPHSLFLFAFSFPPVLSTQEQVSPPPSPPKFQLL